MTHRRALAALLACLALVLVGCTPPRHQAPVQPGASPVVPEDVEPGLEDFYSQPVRWESCGELQCATVRAPLDWDQPGAGEIELRIARDPADGERKGVLLVNPGGPGGSGIELVEQVKDTFGRRVLDAFDVVGFDPRGVGRSSPVRCLGPEGTEALLTRDLDLDTEAGLQEAVEMWRGFGEACERGTGELLAHVGTVSAAKDMDLLRAVLGEETLTYLGYSYGTQLGATYAALFPDRVGRLVLDGAVDPTLDSAELNRGQAEGFERALRSYVEYCFSVRSCPLGGSVEDGLGQISALLERARSTPLRTSDPQRPVTANRLFYAIAVTLYDERSWQFLTQALREAIEEGTGEVAGYLADFYFDREADGTYTSNQTEAFLAINCADAEVELDVERMRAEAERLRQVAPTVGDAFAYAELPCVDWPVPAEELPADYSAKGAPPIVVIGTTGDPATPYAWSENLAKILSSGVLVTYEGDGHTAYGRSNDCVADAVEDYLVDGVVPQDGLVC